MRNFILKTPFVTAVSRLIKQILLLPVAAPQNFKLVTRDLKPAFVWMMDKSWRNASSVVYKIHTW